MLSGGEPLNTFFTILGVGSLISTSSDGYHTVSVAIMLMTIILSSLYIMICNEFIVYHKDIKPIKQALEVLQTSYTTARKIPTQ